MKLLNSTVVVPAPDFNLTTLASVKMEYDIQDDSQDMYLESQIPRVSDDIAGYCRRIFALQRYTDTFNGSPWVRGIRYFLANRPVVPGSVVVDVDGSTLGVGSWSVDYEAGIIDCLTWTGLALSVTYDAGWKLPGWTSIVGSLAGPSLPPSVQFAAIQMVNANRQAGRLQYIDRDFSVRTETVDGVGSITYGPQSGSTVTMGGAGSVAASVMSRLDRFVIPVAR